MEQGLEVKECVMGMGLEEVGTEGVKKAKEKLKNDKKNMEKLKGDIKSKKTKIKRVENGLGTEESNGHFEEGDENECGKGYEICLPKNQNGSVIMKVGGKKKRGQNSGVPDNKFPQSLDELRNGTDDSAVGQGLDRIDVMSSHKKTKKTSKKSVGSSGFGVESMDVSLLTEPEVFEKSNQESVEPFSEGNAFESAEKEERRKTKKNKSIEQEIFEKNNQQGERVEAFSDGHALEIVDKEEKRMKKRKKDVSIVSEVDMQGNDLTVLSDVVTKDEKKRKKENKKGKGESGSSAGTSMDMELELNGGTKGKKGKVKSDDTGAEDPKPKKIKKKFEKNNQQGERVEAFSDGHALETVDKEEKRMKKRKKDASIVSEGDMQGNDLTVLSDVVTKDEKKRKKVNKKGKGESGSSAGTTTDMELELNGGTKGKKGKAKSDDIGAEDHKPKKSKKKVSFSGRDEVLQSPKDNLVHGKRFSKEEDEMVKQAVFNYIETNYLGEEGLNMVLNCKSHPKIRKCWKEIGTYVAHRPQISVYRRAHVLFRRSDQRKWTEEEIEMLRASHKKHGKRWRAVADELGKHNIHVANMWRYIRHANVKKGPWSQDEYQTVFDLVNHDLRTKYAEEKKSKYGMLRDNVPWTSISDKMTTRAESNIFLKWHRKLTSPMVTNGDWADSDDYRLLDALCELDATCYEDVDWDSLLHHRSGLTCQKRWSEMVMHIGDNSKKSFADQVDILAKRYCPELLEAREKWESKPVVH